MFLTADTHIIEPTELFVSRLPELDHYRAPIYRRRPDGTKLLMGNSMILSISQDYFRTVEGSRRSHLIAAADEAGFLADLAADGVWGGLLHPNVGLTIFDMDDSEFAFRCAKIYNDHVLEVYRSERLFPQAVVPLNDIDEAVTQIKRLASEGFKGLEMSIKAPPEGPYFSARYDPVWRTVQDLELMISMHVGTGLKRGSSNPGLSTRGVAFSGPIGASGAWPGDHPDHNAAITAIKTTFGGFGGYGDPIAIETMGHLVGGGVLDRFPGLEVLFVECGARWLANAMDTMDEAWYRGPGVRDVNREYVMPDGRRVQQYQPDELDLEWRLPLMPSEYIRRQIHLTFQDDWVALRNRNITGIEPLLWGNDYSHYEGSWPKSLEAIHNQSNRAGLSAEEQRAIFGGTLARLLGLEIDQLVA